MVRLSYLAHHTQHGDTVKFTVYFLPLVLAACQTATPAPTVGSPEWMAWAEQKAGVTDGQGHGPDHGSQEWCDSLHYRVYGQHAANRAPCNQEWMIQIDRELSR